MKPVVYISKSKVGNPDDLMKLRSWLSDYDCEVTEFFGGTYNTRELDRADILLVVPPKIGDRMNVGKGQHDETCRFTDLKEMGRAFVVSNITDRDGIFKQIDTSMRLNNASTNWTDSYSCIEVEDHCPWELDDIMDHHNIKWVGNEVSHSLLLIASKL